MYGYKRSRLVHVWFASQISGFGHPVLEGGLWQDAIYFGLIRIPAVEKRLAYLYAPDTRRCVRA